jgi:spectrin beta
LCGQLLCFFKDEEDFIQKKAATAPVNIHNAKCEKADDYTKRKNVFRLRLPDGSDFLFLANSDDDMDDWIKKLSFHASLPPNLQLLSYDDSKKQSNSSPDIKAVGTPDQFDGSSVSSRASSPDSQRRDSASSRHNSFGSANSSTMSGPNTPQINFLQKQKEMREQHLEQLKISPSSGGVSPIPSPNNDYQGLSDKPPIPPRGMPPPIPQRQLSYENANVNYRNRNNSSESIDSGNSNNYSNTNNSTPQQARPYSVQPVSPSNDEWNRNSELRLSEKPPPLPISPQPATTIAAKMLFRNDKNTAEWYANHHGMEHGAPQNHHRQVVSAHHVNMQSPPPPLQHVAGGQGSRTTWHHHYIPNHDYNLTGTINNSTGIGYFNNNDGWGNARFETNRPTSLPPPGVSVDLQSNVQPRGASAESSSESESHSISSINSGGKGNKDKDKDKKKFWPFKSKKSKEAGGDKKP